MNFLEKITKRLATLDDQEKALKHPQTAYLFALYVKGANIEECQGAACKDPYYAYLFALYVSEADVKYCQEATCKKLRWAYWFAKDVPGSNIKMSSEACKGTEYEDRLNKLLMERALG